SVKDIAQIASPNSPPGKSNRESAECRRSKIMLALHRNLGLKAFTISIDRRYCLCTTLLPETDHAIFCSDVALNYDLVPFLRVPDVIDWNVIMLAPEKGNSCEWLAMSHHVERGCLALAFSNHPVFNADIC